MSTTTSRRSKALPTDGPTARFLYTIIKQLDLKSIDWNLVASQLEISNGHAARMRYSRFKQQMEGTTSTPRPVKPRKAPNRIEKNSMKGENLFSKRPISPPPVRMKQETASSSARFFPYNANISPYLKSDPFMEQQFPSLAQIPQSSCSESMHVPIPSIEPMMVPYPTPMSISSDFSMQSHLAMFPPRLEYLPQLHRPQPQTPQQSQQPQQQNNNQQQHQSHSHIEANHMWVPVKSEAADDDDCPCEVLIKVEDDEDEDQQPLIEVVREQTAKEERSNDGSD